MASDLIDSQVQDWRNRAALGQLSIDEMKIAIEAIRKERANLEAPKPKKRAATGTAVRPKKQKPEDVNSDDLLKELGI
jgi:uncharacterized small protein (DUF1192 family)